MRVLRHLVALFLGFASTCFAQQSTWTLFTPSGFGPRGGGGTQSTAYDAATDRLIVFGGYNPTGSGETNEVWVLMNASGTGGLPTWQQVIPNAPAGLPATRQAHSAVYDPATNRLIIFGGGQTGGGAFAVLFQDVWVLTFANNVGGTPQWIPLAPSGGPPAPREGHAAVYNQATNEMFLFGGGNNGIMSVPNDLWVLEAANGIGTPTWIQLSETGNVPGRLENFASAYDPASNRWTVVGGCCFYTNASEVLALNQPNGVPQWTSLSPSGTLPPGGDAAVYGYDPVSNRMIVHGIQPGGGGNGTWLLTNANDVGATPAWINLIPEGAPGSPTEGANRVGSAYNARTKKLIHAVTLFDAQGNLVPEVWVLSNADGTATPPTPTGLSAVVGQGSVYLRWGPYPMHVDSFLVDIEEENGNIFTLLGTVTCAPRNVQNSGVTIAQEPSCLLTQLPNGTPIVDGVTYRFAIRAASAGLQSPASVTVLAVSGGLLVGNKPPRPSQGGSALLFFHGFTGSGALNGTFSDTLNFMKATLNWTFGGQLYHIKDEILTTHVDKTGSCVFGGFIFSCLDDGTVDSTGDFFSVNFGSYTADYGDGTGYAHQGLEAQAFLGKLRSDGMARAIQIVAHSNGGLAARSYIERFPVEANANFSRLVTYGTPHLGADVLGYANGFGVIGLQSEGAREATFVCLGSTTVLSDFLFNLDQQILIQHNIEYVSIIGKISGERSNDCQSKFWDSLVPITSANLNNVGSGSISKPVATLTTSRTHGDQGNDFPAILCGLDPNCAVFQVLSPVDIEVTAPNGQKMARDYSAISGASYMNITEDDGHESATVLIPFPQGGQYTISASPKPGTLPTDTFTITLTQNGVTTTIADHLQIQSIPPVGFHPHVNSRPFANAGADQTAECAGPNGTRVTLNGSASGDQDGDTLTYRWTDSLGNVVGNSAIVTTLAQMGTQTYRLTVTDPSSLSATAQTHVTVRDTTPPTVTSSVALPGSVLQQNNHTMTNVGLAVAKSDICTANLSVTVQVFGNEDDQTPTDSQGTVFSPDANNIAPGTLRLRAERSDSGPGRVYLIVVKATDGAGNFSLSASTVVVPKSTSAASTSAVNTLAAAARAFALNPTNKNNPQPPGYFLIGDGPVVGSKQ